jgi:hypothetical protein
MWPTPQAHDSTLGHAERVGRFGTKHGGRNLNDEVMKFPTPNASDVKGPDPLGRRPECDDDLPTRVKRYPTPTARLGTPRGPQAKRYTDPRRSNDLDDAVAHHGDSGQLNPTWVEWLMGFPLGWTDLEPSETPSSPKSPSTSADES